MPHTVFVTGYGSRIVPRSPFVLSFRPPRFFLEHEGKAVAFGPADGGLGFKPLGNASVEDVALDVAEYPPVSVFGLHTEHCQFPVETPSKIFSTPDDTAWPFELQLEDASDSDEMVHIRGPLPSPVDLSKAPDAMKAVLEGRIEKNNGLAVWKEWEYAEQGRPWRQRLYSVALLSTRSLGVERHFAVTAQCASERREALFPFSDKLVAALSSLQ
jgi:hypothetical protein